MQNPPAPPARAVPPPDVPCVRCAKPTPICVCALLQPLSTRVRVLLLQHPREDDHLLGTAALLRCGLARAEVRCGLSWSSLAQATGIQAVKLHRWALVFPTGRAAALRPTQGPRAPAPPPPAAAWYNRAGTAQKKAPPLQGIVLLDGTWKQAKTLLWRNPWLSKLYRLHLGAPAHSLYGRLRREPRVGHVSTLEATAAALRLLGEPEQVTQPLLRALRTLAQRLRDAPRP